MLLSEEYDTNDSKLNIDVYEAGDLRVNDKLKNDCSCFITHLYEDGIRIIVSEEKVFKYVKMGKLYIGLSNRDSISEICICQLSPHEMNHINNELNCQ